MDWEDSADEDADAARAEAMEEARIGMARAAARDLRESRATRSVGVAWFCLEINGCIQFSSAEDQLFNLELGFSPMTKFFGDHSTIFYPQVLCRLVCWCRNS